jgi:hypothetical protein
MTTKHLQELGERVAKALGWRKAAFGNGRWVSFDADNRPTGRANPSDPAEYARLCAEFNVWPYCDEKSCRVDSDDIQIDRITTDIRVEHDNTAVGRLNAATEAALLAIELIIKEREKKE